MREKCGPVSHCCKHCRTKGDLTQREKCGGNSLRWSKVCSIEAELEFRINCSTLAFLSLRKKTATLVSKNHTRKKCDSVNNIIRAVVLLLLCYIGERKTKTALCEIMCCSFVCSNSWLLFSPDLRVYKSDTLPDPPWHFTFPARSISNWQDLLFQLHFPHPRHYRVV